MFNWRDILWARNVTRNEGRELAYCDIDPNNPFEIHWSSWFKNEREALKPQIGDLILIWQRPKEYKPNYKDVQLTHLVTPIDNVVSARSNSDHKWGRRVKVIAFANDGYNPKPRGLKFRSVNQAHSYDITKIESKYTEEELQKVIWNSFEGLFIDDIQNIHDSIIDHNVDDQDLNALEGSERIVTKEHILRERNSSLVKEKKKKALIAGSLICECCGFNFPSTYGNHGNGFIECHHNIPIHLGERITSIDDLALVCSNCHRMLHRKNSEKEYYTIEKLRELIDDNNNQY